MNQYWMVVLIVFIVMTASVLRARYGYQRRRRGGESSGISAQEHAETLRLREEVKALKDRLHVLERIAVEKEDTLSREIEQLRDR